MKRICSMVFLLIVLSSLTSCVSRLAWINDLTSRENKIYTQKLDELFTALDGEDTDKIRSLFSKTVINSDNDLDRQIEKLISVYPKGTSKYVFDGLLAGEYSSEYGKRTSMVYTTFPVVVENEYFWFFLELIYEDDYTPDNIGINRLHVSIADEYYISWNNDDEYIDDIGLFVFAERELSSEVRCIESRPYEFTPIDRSLNINDIETFLSSNKSMAAFTEAFGEPNAKDNLGTCYYEIASENGNMVYLEIYYEYDTIYFAYLVDEFDCIKTIIGEQ